MTTPKPVNCRYYYADFFRGRDHEECRLLKRNPDSRPWRRSLCDSCPVPDILISTNCKEIALGATGGEKGGIMERGGGYAICAKHYVELDNPRYCPECAKE